MKIDLLIAEIGSTTTVVNAFDGVTGGAPVFLGQGMAPTSIAEGDVTLGLDRARADLGAKFGASSIEAESVFATSSAAGGLSMTVHGLVPDMTVRAAREAALGSGAVLRDVTSGRLRPFDVERVRSIRPRIVMVAGGVDHGERETALFNFEKLAEALPDTPILYAGNSDNVEEIRAMAGHFGIALYVTENVYPTLDELNVAPAREVIQSIFEAHIVEAPGMGHIREAVTGTIMPTPGAVMAMAECLYDVVGDLVVFDVGGATTDVHSVTEGSDRFRDLMTAPEPFSKRTVEGDLGVFVNRRHVLKAMTYPERRALVPDYESKLAAVPEIPRSPEEADQILPLVDTCCREALSRHAGKIVELFTPRGREKIVRGRDLTAVETVIATGGALTRLPGAAERLRRVFLSGGPERLYPPGTAGVMIDHNYFMASCGVMARTFPEAAVSLMKNSFAAR